jgi:hypothetical protein
MLGFVDLQDCLRTLLLSRVDSGELTGISLAQRARLRQPHISNFFNRKRGLSLSSLDHVLAAEDLSVLDLIPPEEINRRASIPPPPEDGYAHILLVPPHRTFQPRIYGRDVIEVLKFKDSVLRRMRAEPSKQRATWLRFVMIQPRRADCDAMAPRLGPGCTVLLDRHYDSFAPYRRGEKTMFAIRKGSQLVIRYAHLDGATVVLEPESRTAHTRLVHLARGTRAEGLILGRVAYIGLET